MNTMVYECGCSITFSMFGKQEVVDAHLCEKHQQEHPDILDLIVKTIRDIHST